MVPGGEWHLIMREPYHPNYEGIVIETLIRGFFTNFSIVMLMLSALAAVITTWTGRGAKSQTFAEALFRWVMLLGVGAPGLFTAYFHIVHPSQSAELIGWEPSPFQFEVGVADAAIGVLGILAFWGNFGFRLAATIACCIWYGGDAIGHVQQMIVARNFAPGNAGPYFWSDVLVPLILAGTLFITWRTEHPRS